MREPLLDSNYLERLERLTLHWNKSFPGLVGGHNISRFAGAGQEFLDHRVFHPGDDLRSVNWRAYMRLDKLFLKMFQVEPRVPVRIMLDNSLSMTVGHAPGQPSKYDLARKLAASLAYVGLVRLDTITLQPFSNGLHDPYICVGGRHRFQPAEQFLRVLAPDGATNFLKSARQFIGEYSHRGLVIVISDFLDDGNCFQPLQYLIDYGHELMLLQLWGDEDRVPSGDGELELTDAESGSVVRLSVNSESREQYTANFDRYSNELRQLALRRGGRYAGLPTSVGLEEAMFGFLVRSQGVM
jgi:uncharacterized protein (DUF58 family)